MSTIFKIDDLLIDLKDATPGGVAFTEKTEIPTLSVVQRLAVLRRVQLLIDKPLDLHVLRTYRTVGELWSWMSDTLNGDAPGTPRLFVSNSATTRIRLRPIQESDLMSLYMSAMDPGEGIRWRFRGATIPPDQFVATLYDGVRCQYAVEDQTSRDLVGLVVAYDHRDIAGHCKIGFYRVANSNVPNAWGATTEGLVCLIHHLFSSYPYKKVYAEIPAYNMPLVDGFRQEYMTEEGCLRDHTYAGGSCADTYILSLSRDRWDDFYSKW